MTRSEYMNSLQEKLEKFGKELQEEIMEDYRQHFAEGEKQGRTEEEIIDELGNVEEMIRELAEMDQDRDPDNEYRTIERERNCTYTGEYKGIELAGEEADIRLEVSDGNQIQVDYKNDGNMKERLQYEFYQYDKDGKFYAGVKRRNSGENQKVKILGKMMFTYQSGFFKGSNGTAKLTVKVPKGMPQVLVSVASGDISAHGLEAGDLQCKTGSGDINISAVRLKKIQINCGSGDIAVSDIGSESGSLQSSSGDIVVKNAQAEAFSCNTASGDIAVKNAEVSQLACSTASGDISIEARVRDCRCSTESGDLVVKAADAERIKCNTASGDVSLHIKDVDGVEAKVSQGCGDAVVFEKGEGGKKISGGTYTYGNGACKFKASIGSGDMKLHIL